MESSKIVVMKITADKRKYDFINEVVMIESCNDSYIKVSSPFYRYIYEKIEGIRKNAKDS